MPSTVLVIILVLCILSLLLLVGLYGKDSFSYGFSDRAAVRACLLIQVLVIALIIWSLGVRSVADVTITPAVGDTSTMPSGGRHG